MRRTTIKISDELGARLRYEAERRAVATSDITREALKIHLGLWKRRPLGAAMAPVEVGGATCRSGSKEF